MQHEWFYVDLFIKCGVEWGAEWGEKATGKLILAQTQYTFFLMAVLTEVHFQSNEQKCLTCIITVNPGGHKSECNEHFAVWWQQCDKILII